MGDRAILLEVGALDDVLALHAALAARAPDGVVDLVPAARTVLVRVDPRVLPLAAARAWALAAAAARAAAPRSGRRGRARHRLRRRRPRRAPPPSSASAPPSSRDVTPRRRGRWPSPGFAPGFGYLVSADWPFDVPRLDSPRTRVPAGAVGLAAGFTGAYPRDTPGGWRLIGTTRAPLFDPDAASPALLAPGTRVRFRPSPRARAGHGELRPSPRDRNRGADACRAAARGPVAAADGPGIRIVEPGLLATLQDLGGRARHPLGVARPERSTGRPAHRQPLLGNPEGAAAIEVTMGGLRAVADADLWVAVTGRGAHPPRRARGRPVRGAPLAGRRELHLDWFGHGARAYLAVRGGLDGAACSGRVRPTCSPDSARAAARR